MSQHDMVIDNGPGLGVRTDFNAALQALASSSLGPIEPTVMYAGQLWLDTSVASPGRLRMRDLSNAAWIDLPIAAPVTAQTRNRIVNGAMQISQENLNNPSGALGAPAYYAADQWLSQGLTTGTVNSVRAQLTTPNGSKDRYRILVATTDTSLTTGEYLTIVQILEGNRIADFRYGTASAKQAILRFGFKGPAGTYSISIRNNAIDRSYVAIFTISAGQANADTEQVFVIPGDTIGTWLTDTGVGLRLVVTIAAAPSFLGVVGWQAGNFLGTSANSNGLAALSTFELFDVGLYLEAQTGVSTGLPPPWQMPDEAQELEACQRYWQKHVTVVDTAAAWQAYAFPVQMRIAPAVTGGGAGFTLGGTAGPDMYGASQTGRAVQTLTFNARL